MRKKIITLLILGIIFTGIGYAISVSAQSNDYTVLAPLPGTTMEGPAVGGGSFTNLQTYIPGLFNLLIGLSAVAAILMIVIGGFQYMSTDAIQGKQQGKERIKNAIFGLVLVISAWLILYTINPKLLRLNLDIEPITTTASGASVLQPAAIAALDDLMAACPGCVTVTSTTGGTHSINSAHYQGRAMDIAPNADLNTYLTGSSNNPPAPCQVVTRPLGGITARFLWEPTGSTCGGTVPSSGDHWHMSVSGGASGGW